MQIELNEEEIGVMLRALLQMVGREREIEPETGGESDKALELMHKIYGGRIASKKEHNE